MEEEGDLLSLPVFAGRRTSVNSSVLCELAIGAEAI
jgi:hypothetical protein